MMDKRAAQALEEGGVMDQLVNGLALMTESESQKMMRIYEAAMPEELKKLTSWPGRRPSRRWYKKGRRTRRKKRKIRLIDEGVQRKYFPKGSGPGETLNAGAY